MGKFSRLGNDLYQGRKSYDFVERKALWYGVSGVLVALAILVVVVKGLNFGVEFTGGTQYRIDNLSSSVSGQDTADTLRDEIGESSDLDFVAEPTVTTSGENSIIIQVEEVTDADDEVIRGIIADVTGVDANGDDVSQDEIGASWGRAVAERAIIGVAIFLALVVLFIWAYFREWKMSVAALVALFHDIALTVGVYALSGFPVTPAAVTGLLAILGFSMYDTVVVFDKVRENTHELKQKGQTYAQAANLAVNQTLVRSINTSIVALIPIGAILYVSAVQLGASSLKDLALAQFVGMAAGLYSSIFIAPRILVQMKGRESAVQLSDRRARSRALHDADRYASVPAFTEDMPIHDEPGEEPNDDARVAGGPPPVRDQRPEASNRGRNVPEPTRPVRNSAASGRVQPARQPKSKRGKK